MRGLAVMEVKIIIYEKKNTEEVNLMLSSQEYSALLSFMSTIKPKVRK